MPAIHSIIQLLIIWALTSCCRVLPVNNLVLENIMNAFFNQECRWTLQLKKYEPLSIIDSHLFSPQDQSGPATYCIIEILIIWSENCLIPYFLFLICYLSDIVHNVITEMPLQNLEWKMPAASVFEIYGNIIIGMYVDGIWLYFSNGFHDSIKIICTTRYNKARLASIFWWIWVVHRYSIPNLYCKRLIQTAVSPIWPMANFWHYQLRFLLFLHFHFPCDLFSFFLNSLLPFHLFNHQNYLFLPG